MTELTVGFNAICVDCKVYYKKGLFDHEVERLVDLKKEIRYYKNTDSYIKCFIEHIKTNVIKKLPNLTLVEINLGCFDRNNILHRFMITITEMIQNLLKIKEKINHYKSVFVIVTYENKIEFVGNLNFAGLD
jgi:hypothetical protein